MDLTLIKKRVSGGGMGFLDNLGKIVLPGAVAFFALVLLIHRSAGAVTAQDIVAPAGCAMAHCDQALTDNAHLSPPLGQIAMAWRDRNVSGSSFGLGCSSNSAVVACSFKSTSGKPADLRVYGPRGGLLWGSRAFGASGYLSSPIIGPDNGVIMADESRIVRFSSTGAIIWSTLTAGGTPFSPNITDNGEIILAALSGPVSAYDYATGVMLAQSSLDATIQYNGSTYTGFFDTLNTPAIKGNRIYVSTQFKYNSSTGVRSLPVGRLIVLDLVTHGQGAHSFQVAWLVEFRAPSGASPALGTDEQGRTVIFFDGTGSDPAGANAPQAFAVTDMGTSGEFLWKSPLPVMTQTSPARDPRGGVWYYGYGGTNLLRLSETTGERIQTINVTTLMNEGTTFKPYSALTISGEAAAPVMIIGVATSYFSPTAVYVVAIDLTNGSRLWRYRVDEGKGTASIPHGQFPIVLNSSGQPVVVFSTFQNGVWALTSGTAIQMDSTPMDSSGGVSDTDSRDGNRILSTIPDEAE